MSSVSTPLDVSADLRFEVDLPDREPLAGTLRGHGRRLELRVSDPSAFAGRADSGAVRGMAGALASRGLTVTVVTGDTPLVTLGDVRTSWLQRRITGSRHMRVGGAYGTWTAWRARLRASDQPVLPDRTLAPPPTLFPVAPTFLRRRRTVTTTHDPAGGGDPRLVVAPREDLWPDDGRPVFSLRDGVTTIGSGETCDIRLPGLEDVHAEVRHDSADEYVVVHLGRGAPVRVNGEPVRQRILRTGSRVDLAGVTLTYYREEYADHGRPYGGRIGGELGRQRPQPPRHRMQGRLQDPGVVPQGEVS